MSDDPVLIQERHHLDTALLCLDAMRAGAERIADYGVDALASEGLGRLRAQRLEHLGADLQAPPFFGRTDRDSDLADRGNTALHEEFHIGRRHIRDAQGDPVVIDWRAPIARPFYQATPADRQGVTLRRRFGFAHGTLTSYEDEHLDRGENLGLASDLLREEIERPRVGPMRDIVATIQPDQDEIVRAPLDDSLCIQGAPGTGKTAVGLHRAAYLLYTYPERLRRSGVLVVGPNAAFLRYIAQVLPALGEDGITQTTVDDLVASVPVRRLEPVEASVLKGDPRMAEVLRTAVLAHVAKPADDVVAIIGTRRYRVPVERVRRYVDDARRAVSGGELRWDSARERLRQRIAQDVRLQRENAGGAPSDAETQKVARSPQVKEFLSQVWPAIEPRALLVRLYTDAGYRSRHATGILDDDEIALLHWDIPIPKNPKTAKFSAADRTLLDEIAGLLAAPDSYVHVVVDEAQDLSAMQCRAVARRCPLGSITVLGDLAQATAPWAAGSWQSTLAHLGQPEAVVRPLTTGYRVPGEVLAVANRLLPHIAAGVPAATSIRGGADALRIGEELLAAVRRCLASEGSIAVIVPDARTDEIAKQLVAAGIPSSTLETDEPGRVTIVPATAAKGLEYDSVVLVEPAEIVAGETSHTAGLRRLYVAWTRAVSRLAVVHTSPLPEELSA